MRRDRRAFSSRANAQKSTGPKTPAGKATAARNAHRHGLNLPVLDDPALSREVDDVARKIAKPLIGAEPKGRQRELACRIAEPVIDLRRVREAKLPLISALQGDPTDSATLKQLVRLGRYERRALWRRKVAVREFCVASLAPPQATDRARRIRGEPPGRQPRKTKLTGITATNPRRRHHALKGTSMRRAQ